MNIIKSTIKLSLNIACWPLYAISTAMPKSKNVWIFNSWHGRTFSDNSKHLYLYIQNNRKNIKAVWITKNNSLTDELRRQGVNAFYFLSLRGIYYQSISSAAFFTHHQNTEFFSPLLSRKTELVQLWHGTPIKKILLDTLSYKKTNNSTRARLVEKLFPWRRNSWSFVISPSEVINRNLSTAFAGNKLIVTGYPRNDRITARRPSDPIFNTRKLVYMPTFRGENSTEDSDSRINRLLFESGFNISEIDKFLLKRNLELTIRLHPSNKLNTTNLMAIERTTTIKVSPPEIDIYDIINDFDILITDYSSIVFDFILSGKPIIHTEFDLHEYITDSRELYYSFDDICLTPEITRWSEVFGFIDKIESHGLSTEYMRKYKNIAKDSNYFFDNNSSDRVYKSTLELITK